MAHQFALADKNQPGYDIAQVDEFISKARAQFNDFSSQILPSDHLRRVEFDLVHGGYLITAVDDAIARLEDAFAKNEIVRQLANAGKFAVDDRFARIKGIVIGRTERPAGSKFNRVSWIMRGYNRKQVDAIAEHVERHLVSGAPLSFAEVRGAIFKASRGGYVEGQVDAFLDRVIELLQLEAHR
ncbi:MAG: hypothetical protein RL167_844 [Actinomycetota bacterium]